MLATNVGFTDAQNRTLEQYLEDEGLPYYGTKLNKWELRAALQDIQGDAPQMLELQMRAQPPITMYVFGQITALSSVSRIPTSRIITLLLLYLHRQGVKVD